MAELSCLSPWDWYNHGSNPSFDRNCQYDCMRPLISRLTMQVPNLLKYVRRHQEGSFNGCLCYGLFSLMASISHRLTYSWLQNFPQSAFVCVVLHVFEYSNSPDLLDISEYSTGSAWLNLTLKKLSKFARPAQGLLCSNSVKNLTKFWWYHDLL